MEQHDNLVVLKKVNEVWMKIIAAPNIQQELWDYLTFDSENQFDPRIRKKKWSGKIHLIKWESREVYIGLFDEIAEFCISAIAFSFGIKSC